MLKSLKPNQSIISTDSPVVVTQGLGSHYLVKEIVGRLSSNCRAIVGRSSGDCRAIVGQLVHD